MLFYFCPTVNEFSEKTKTNNELSVSQYLLPYPVCGSQFHNFSFFKKAIKCPKPAGTAGFSNITQTGANCSFVGV